MRGALFWLVQSRNAFCHTGIDLPGGVAGQKFNNFIHQNPTVRLDFRISPEEDLVCVIVVSLHSDHVIGHALFRPLLDGGNYPDH